MLKKAITKSPEFCVPSQTKLFKVVVTSVRPKFHHKHISYFVAQGFPNSGGLWAINFCPAQISGFKLLPTNFNIQRQKLHARIPREKTVCGPWIWLDPIDWSFFLLTIWTRPTKYCEHLMLTHKIVPQMCARKTG